MLILAGNDWTRVPFLRQQVKKREGRPNMCLADFIDPDGEDWIGGFAVGIHGLEPHLERFKQTVDDYDDILLKALADRLAESLAEVLHAHVRNRLWAYADEHFSNEQLIRESYHGPSGARISGLSDHSLKPMLFDMLGGAPGEVSLTENFAMLPTSAVSGFYFAHRDASYFGVARIAGPACGICRTTTLTSTRGKVAAAQSRLAIEGRLALQPMLRWLLLFLALFAAPATAQLAPHENAIQPELVAEGPASPGGEVELAIVMHTQPGWHGYWVNPGDAGLPMEIKWQLPSGAGLGPLRFPVPDRLLVAGIVNYVYERDHALLTRLTAPKDASGGCHCAPKRIGWPAPTRSACPSRGACRSTCR